MPPEMNSATWAAVGAVAAAVIALAGVAVAIWQARIAKDAATAAAEYARESAQAAVTQATAAVEQTRLLEQQVQAESADREARDAPVFVLSSAAAEVGTYVPLADGSRRFTVVAKSGETDVKAWLKRIPVDLTMNDGPAEISASIEPGGDPGAPIEILDPGPHRMVPRSKTTFAVVAAYKFTDQDIELLITSRDSTGLNRQWQSRHIITV